jgi:hypothetical protein
MCDVVCPHTTVHVSDDTRRYCPPLIDSADAALILLKCIVQLYALKSLSLALALALAF